MSSFRSQIKEYLDKWPNNKAVDEYDFEKNIIKYGKRRDGRAITRLPGDEEYVRAYVLTKLVNELGYSMDDIELEKTYTIGRPNKAGARMDVIVVSVKCLARLILTI